MQISIANNITSSDKPKINRLWVDYDLFSRIATKLTDYNKRHFKSRSRWNINLKNEINLFSVPAKDRAHYGIPLDNELIVAQIERLKVLDAEERATGQAYSVDEKRTQHVHNEMIAALCDFAGYRNRVASYLAITSPTANVPKEKITDFAKKWAVWVWIMENYTRFDKSLEIYHAAYSVIFPEQFSGENGKVSFKNFYNKCEANGIEATIIDRRSVVKVGKRRSPVQMAFLQTLFIQSRKVTAADAAKKLVEFCSQRQGEKAIGHSNVKIIFREFQNNEELHKARYGDAASQKGTAHASLLPAEHRNTQWQIDGWTMPFWGANFQRYVLYMIRDNHSRKILGYSVAESENTELILAALDDAMRNTGVWPGELVSDKHSFHKTAIASRLRVETEKLGSVWTVTINAQRNQLAERYNQYMDAILKEFPGYLGKNMTATSKDARPAPEVLTELAKTANFKTFDEIKSLAGYAVVEFNRGVNLPASLTNGVKQVANERYDASESTKAFPISEADRVRLIRPITAYKVTRSQINIRIGIRKHEFVLPADISSQYNNREVEVTYEDLTEGIYVCDLTTGEMLCFVKPKVKIHGAIPDQTPEDITALNKLAGKKNGTATQAKKSALARIADGLKDNPEAMALINTHAMPKDIRQIAQQDAEVKRHLAEQGVKRDMVPVRKVAALELTPRPEGSQKKKPFAPAGPVKVGKIDINDFLNN